MGREEGGGGGGGLVFFSPFPSKNNWLYQSILLCTFTPVNPPLRLSFTKSIKTLGCVATQPAAIFPESM